MQAGHDRPRTGEASRAGRRQLPDITKLPDLAHDAARAGPVRTRRPVYLDLLPPCNAGCPAGENIQAWLAQIQAGRTEQAWRQLVADNPLPAIHGRVCYHPCRPSATAQLDSSVSIHAVERFLGDQALARGWAFDPPPPPSGQRILVIGAGPSGLSAAYHLARRGHQVEIRDASPEPGGMMRYGIPAYRLPREVLAGEISRIQALGVRIICGHRVTDLAAERHEGRFASTPQSCPPAVCTTGTPPLARSAGAGRSRRARSRSSCRSAHRQPHVHCLLLYAITPADYQRAMLGCRRTGTYVPGPGPNRMRSRAGLSGHPTVPNVPVIWAGQPLPAPPILAKLEVRPGRESTRES